METRRKFKFDFAPGEDHITLRDGNKCYYVPEIFHASRTFNIVCPLLIKDVYQVKSMFLIYGMAGFKLHTSGCVILNNHPIKQINLVGKIIDFKSIELDLVQKFKNFMILEIDDSSDAEKLRIKVKVREPIFRKLNIDLYKTMGLIIKVTGTLAQYQGDLNLNCEVIEILGKNNNFEIEFASWIERLEFRDTILIHPWIYKSPSPISNTSSLQLIPESRLNEKQLKRKRDKQNLDLRSESMSESNDHIISKGKEDSLILNQNKRLRMKTGEQPPTPHSHEEPIEIIDTDDDNDNDEISIINHYSLSNGRIDKTLNDELMPKKSQLSNEILFLEKRPLSFQDVSNHSSQEIYIYPSQ